MPAESVIERLKRLEAFATKRPWRVRWWSDARDPGQVACGIDGPEHFGFCGDDSNDIVRASKDDSGVSTGDNADLIVAMRNALPLLLRVAEAAERVADRDAIQRGRTIHAGNADWERDKFLRDVAPLFDDLHEAVRALRAGGERA